MNSLLDALVVPTATVDGESLDHAVCLCSPAIALCGHQFDNEDLLDEEFTGEFADDCVVCDDISWCPRCGHDFTR
jgi:hypothetical protein